ncbi:class I SAM-dependent methyltransferase [Chlorogloea sp. CCALA 695]|uniref:class I SAM-dependent methyltransferase n=1 Tax=Chlorogloea sp. CCALA 695 TaxID=2107693 RepID=UPI000D07A455|nr:methyltransferase domain-containing protein [Chlorogloea sp. CCALA 695]PSB32753.1 methyltransferase type 11 [Chlorogloea sp. CCALA 695]
MNYLNLGCGSRFHPKWTNIDFDSQAKEVISCNLSEGIPFPDGFFDLVYHSHLLEHFPKSLAEPFIKECYRVLRPKGILRVVIPDLEQIARLYLTAFEKVSNSPQEWQSNYEWVLLEMYDQTVRNKAGGYMADYLFKDKITNEEFVISRCGSEAKKLIAFGHQQRQKSQVPVVIESKPKQVLKKVYLFFRYSTYRRESLIKLLLAKEYTALQIGRFRQSGEIHQWMYDSYSLSVLLEKCGFENIVQRNATESYLTDWNSFKLDTEIDGTVYKPDSLFMEAIKPAT